MTPEQPDLPTFAAWTHENLVREVEKLVLGMS